jgi:hypothetical protein
MFLNRLPSAHPNQFDLQPQTSLSQSSSRIPIRCSNPSSSPLAITNTPPSTQQPANTQFENAEGVVVNGGRFTNARGDVVNNVGVDVIINLTKRMPGFKMCRFPRTHS